MKSGNKRPHNKSNSCQLSILNQEDEKINSWYIAMQKSLISKKELIQNSSCLLLPNNDGRFSYKQKKVAFGYQIVAYKKFGREEIGKVTASKYQDDLLISHLCGTRNCCEISHIVLEVKGINDTRTYCHWCMRNAKEKNNWAGVQLFLESGACIHKPQCCSLSDFKSKI